jgi:hypothetical protein
MNRHRQHSSTWSIQNASRRVGAVVLLSALGACAPAATRAAQSAADREATVERTRCGGQDDERSLAPVFHGEAIQDVEALYRGGDATPGARSEVRGVSITVRALPGMTAESLDRALQCHSAKATLGDSRGAWDDPFFLPGSFVSIDVRGAGYGFEVEVAGSSSDEGYAILTRAQAFAKEMATAPRQLTASR